MIPAQHQKEDKQTDEVSSSAQTLKNLTVKGPDNTLKLQIRTNKQISRRKEFIWTGHKITNQCFSAGYVKCLHCL